MSGSTKKTTTRTSRQKSDAEAALGVAQRILAACTAEAPDRKTLGKVLAEVRKLVDFDAASLYLLDRGRHRLVEVGSIGGRVEPLEFLNLGEGDGLSGWVARHRKPVLLTNRPSGPVDDISYATFLSLPLIVGADLIGVVNLGCTAPEAICQQQVKRLSFVVDVLALAVERQQYAAAVAQGRKSLADLQSQLQATVKSSVSPDTLLSLGELASSVNHAINNPLAVIVGNVQFLIHDNVATNQKTLSRLRRIEQAALHISDVNRNLVRLHSMTHAAAGATGESHSKAKDT